MAARALARLQWTSSGQLTPSSYQVQRRHLFNRRFSTSPPESSGSQAESNIPLSPIEGESVYSLDSSCSKTLASLSAVEAPSDDKKFEASIKVYAPFARLLAGKRGKTKEKIEEATSSDLYIPSADEFKSNPFVVVKGPSQESVNAAIREIERVVEKASKNPNLQYSHFISLPLASHPILLVKVRSLRDSILADQEEADSYISWFPETADKTGLNVKSLTSAKKLTKIVPKHFVDPELESFFSDDDESSEDESGESMSSRRIHSSLFINPSTFHLTVLMLRLSSDERVHTACEVLQGVKDKVLECLEGRPVTVHLKGMDLMKGNRSDARVLYMRVQEDQDDRLVRACQAIADAYKEAGLVSESERKFKMHATLMNTVYSRKNRSFDARKILMKHRLIDWGQHSIQEVHLSQRFVYDENGYYHCCASIPFPASNTA